MGRLPNAVNADSFCVLHHAAHGSDLHGNRYKRRANGHARCDRAVRRRPSIPFGGLRDRAAYHAAPSLPRG